MRKISIICLLVFFSLCSQVSAYWIWTKETNKWTNPKYEPKDNPKSQLAYAIDFFNQGNYKKARVEFQRLINSYSKSAEAAEAQYYIGRCLEELGDPYAAFKAYQKVIDKYPFSERITEIIKKEYDIGEKLLEQKVSVWQYISGTQYPVMEVFRAVINNAPYSEYAPASYYKIGLFLKEMSSYSEAKEEFSKIVSEYPQSEWVERAKYQIALCDYKESLKPDYDQTSTKDAKEKFDEFVKANPETELSQQARDRIDKLREKEAESNYNIAKFYEKQKAYDSAKIYYQYVIKVYPDSVWADLSRERLKILEIK